MGVGFGCRKGKAMTTIKDELNPDLMLQGIATELLVKAARREIDLTQLARQELANRGLNQQGQWVGFDQANAIWQHGLYSAFNAKGERVLVTIPESE